MDGENLRFDAADFQVERLRVVIHPDRVSMGLAAAQAVARRMRESIDSSANVSVVFASAPSQNEFLAALAREPGLDWQRVIAFHMDEYIGLPADMPQNFGRFLRDRLFDAVQPGRVYYIDGNAPDPEEEAMRYAQLLLRHPPDIVCAGIGENGHLAFNDPPDADFEDPRLVKTVKLALKSRQQQVNDGNFAHLQDVPEYAITLTIPALLSARFFSCVVPARSKADAVYRTLMGPISTDCPASILRQHAGAVLHLDPFSAAGVRKPVD